MTLAVLKTEIETHIAQSSQDYLQEFPDAWVLKFFPPQYLGDFLRQKQPVISTSAGFTWGDGAYVVPLASVLSAMIYGRVGLMGSVDHTVVQRVYDARSVRGIALYQEWIQNRPRLFDLLTTTVHAQQANRSLRNAFRKTMDIDLVVFRPDEFNRTYVQPKHDSWFVVSDFSAQKQPVVGVPRTNKVRDCEFVAIGAEEFTIVNNGFTRRNWLGRDVDASGLHVPTPATVTNIQTALQHMHSTNTTNSTRGLKPSFVLLAP